MIMKNIHPMEKLYFKIICVFKLNIVALTSTANVEAIQFLRPSNRLVTCIIFQADFYSLTNRHYDSFFHLYS